MNDGREGSRCGPPKKHGMRHHAGWNYMPKGEGQTEEDEFFLRGDDSRRTDKVIVLG